MSPGVVEGTVSGITLEVMRRSEGDLLDAEAGG